jgi:anti-sigma factor RsiW
MDCSQARTGLLARARGGGTLDPEEVRAIDEHLAGCEACRREDAADRALSDVLERRLPKRKATSALHASLRARWAAPPIIRKSRFAYAMAALGAMAAGAAFVLLALFVGHTRDAGHAMVAEAVNDHLRVLYSQHPLEVESGGIHQVKPWFEGKLDFAPVTGFAGDDEFPLQGGLVAYFVDRKAAAYVFKRRLHVISLFVFPSEGFAWPAVNLTPVGPLRGSLETTRGFHVVLWRQNDLGYALVSDVDEHDLLALAAKVVVP